MGQLLSKKKSESTADAAVGKSAETKVDATAAETFGQEAAPTASGTTPSEAVASEEKKVDDAQQVKTAEGQAPQGMRAATTQVLK